MQCALSRRRGRAAPPQNAGCPTRRARRPPVYITACTAHPWLPPRPFAHRSTMNENVKIDYDTAEKVMDLDGSKVYVKTIGDKTRADGVQ